MRILVTGYNGFIGRHLCRRLLTRRGVKLFGVSANPARVPGVRSVRADIRDPRRLDALLRSFRPDRIFHFAGSSPHPGWREMMEGQLGPAVSLMQAVRRLGGKRPRVILPGSAAEYGRVPLGSLPVRESSPTYPINAYGAAKRAQTAAAQSMARAGLDVVVARIFNVLGPGLGASLALASFVRQTVEIERGRRRPVLETGNLAPKRDFVDVSDTVDALLLIAGKGRRGEVYNVASGRSVTMRSLVRELISLSNRRIRLKQTRARIRKVDIPDMRGSTAKLRRLGSWRARISPSRSLRAMLEFERARLRG